MNPYRVTLDRIELPRALFRREPYILAVISTESQEGGEINIRTEPARGINRNNAWAADLELLPLAPHGWCALDIVVMESDAGARRAGERISSARSRLTDTKLGKALTSGAKKVGSAGVAVAGVIEVAGRLASLLMANGDDVLARFSLRFDGGDPAPWSHEAPRIRVYGRFCGAEAPAAVVISGPSPAAPVAEAPEPKVKRRGRRK